MSNMSGKSVPMFGPPDRETRGLGGVGTAARWVGGRVGLAADRAGRWCVRANLALACYFGLVDLPLSLVGDLVTLPGVVREARNSSPTRSAVTDSALPNRK